MDFLTLLRNLGLPIEIITLVMVIFLYRKSEDTCKELKLLSERLWAHVTQTKEKGE